MKNNLTLEEKVAQLVKEEISIVPYNPSWPKQFAREENYLKKLLPSSIIKRIEHFGSTAIPGLDAKPIIDLLIEVSSYKEVDGIIVPILEAKGYEYLWRPALGNEPPFYAWFIKRNKEGQRTHHLHMVVSDCPLWDRIYFRDYLRIFPEIAQKYQNVKNNASKKNKNDRIGYARAKRKFVDEIEEKAKKYFVSNPKA